MNENLNNCICCKVNLLIMHAWTFVQCALAVSKGSLLAVQPYLVPLHGRLPPHDNLITSNRVPLHAKYRFASWIITDITHHCNVPSVAAQLTVTHRYTSSLPAGKTQFCNQQASSSSSSSNFQQHNSPFVLTIPSTPFMEGVQWVGCSRERENGGGGSAGG